MEQLFSVAEWEESLRNGGFAEHFESFFDFFPYDGDPYPNEAMTPEESSAVVLVHKLMVEALNATPVVMTNDQYAATGWPQRIAPLAEQALKLMLKRGRFSEENEEAEPSTNDGWPWRPKWSTR